MTCPLRLIFLWALIFPLTFSSAHALVGDDTILSGQIRSFDDKEVQLISNNKIFLVPRKLILLSDFKQGQTISVNLTFRELDALKTHVPPKGKAPKNP